MSEGAHGQAAALVTNRRCTQVVSGSPRSAWISRANVTFGRRRDVHQLLTVPELMPRALARSACVQPRRASAVLSASPVSVALFFAMHRHLTVSQATVNASMSNSSFAPENLGAFFCKCPL